METEIVDLNQTITPGSISIAVDTGDGMTAIVIPYAGPMSIENVVQEGFNTTLPDRISHLVLRIPVFQDDNGIAYTIRRMVNTD